MREAPAVPIIEGLLARGAKVRAFDPEARDGRAGASSSNRIHYATDAYDALDGRRRAARRHRVERVPRAGLREDEAADEAAGDLRRPQHLRSRRRFARSASPTRRSAVHEHGARDRRRRLRRQPRRARRWPRPATTSSSTTICRRATRRPSTARARRFPRDRSRSSRGDILDGRRVLAALARRRGATAVHALRGAAARSASRCASRSSYYRDQRHRHADACSTAMAEAGVEALRLLVDGATFGEPLTTPIDETHPQRPINAYGETQAGGRAGAAALRARARHPVGGAAVLQRRRRRSGRAASARTTIPRST